MHADFDLFMYVFDYVELKNENDKHNTELKRTDPGKKVTGEFSTRGRIFPSSARNIS